MDRAAFVNLLVRAVKDSHLTEGEAIDLLKQFDAGTLQIDEDATPLDPEEAISPLTDEDVERAVAALLLLGALRVLHLRRAHFREVLQDQFIAGARSLAKQRAAGAITLTDWQAGMNEAIGTNIIQQAAIGSGSVPAANALTEAVVLQEAYLSRWADEMAVKTLLDEPLSELGMMARAALYAGAGREEGYKAEAELYESGTAVIYEAVDDNGTCQPCLDAEGTYLIDEAFPTPGSVCDGYGNCRCTLSFVEGAAA